MSKPKLLLADDSPTVQKVITLTFADRGMEVASYSDGDSALADLERVRPDIVLADVHMPGTDGYKLCELLRSDESFRNVPVLLLVGSFEPFDRDEAMRVGANGHLTKPFSSIAELISSVESLIVPRDEPREVEASQQKVDTSDIDQLYVQSFVETVEIPRDAEVSADFLNETFDDEMMETSYTDQDPDQEIDSAFYSKGEEAEFDDELETDSLIANSMPSQWSEPEVPQRETEAAFTRDPFETVADEITINNDEVSDEPATRSGSSEDDLLELPSSGAIHGRGDEIAVLSPELIDQIVDKVVERLSKKLNDQSLKMGG